MSGIFHRLVTLNPGLTKKSLKVALAGCDCLHFSKVAHPKIAEVADCVLNGQQGEHFYSASMQFATRRAIGEGEKNRVVVLVDTWQHLLRYKGRSHHHSRVPASCLSVDDDLL